MTRTAWTDERTETVRKMAAQGYGLKQIAKKVRADHKTVRARAEEHGIEIKRRGLTWTDEEVARLRQLARDGATIDEAAVILRRTRTAIENRCHRVNPKIKFRRANACDAVPKQKKQQEYKRRTCLIGGHPFEARIDENGRFLEFSCAQHRTEASKQERAALI